MDEGYYILEEIRASWHLPSISLDVGGGTA